MFWKKRRSKKPEDPLSLEWTPGARSYFRVRPAANQPVSLEISGQACKVLDISAGGMAIVAASTLKIGRRYQALLHIPQDPEPVSMELEVLNRKEQLARCEIVNIDEDQRERIHLYVLKRQKAQKAET